MREGEHRAKSEWGKARTEQRECTECVCVGKDKRESTDCMRKDRDRTEGQLRLCEERKERIERKSKDRVWRQVGIEQKEYTDRVWKETGMEQRQGHRERVRTTPVCSHVHTANRPRVGQLGPRQQYYCVRPTVPGSGQTEACFSIPGRHVGFTERPVEEMARRRSRLLQR
ncbi:hypothetical protein PoB_000944700 [Plakobranchus ocellatus]|uniref:Uncharacterized protein n=1 Tax=Plakobranchus ocellatus TaxID=259542 RepID=A0AAV3YLD1_9GAST|nr:hypothetical protein PoB_000944700 [Plakobranchus ocellatus]